MLVLVLVLAIVDISCTLSLNQTLVVPLSIVASDDTGTCLTQQQRDTALDSFRNKITSFLNIECGEGLWTRVAYLNMSDPMQSCPPAWRDRSANGVRVCGLPAGSYHQCHSIFYHTDHSFTRICGQVIAYQYGYPDSFHRSTIDQPYVEGVSITHGRSQRSHIWTFAADGKETSNTCPCEGGGSPPSFVGNNYYCESGYKGTSNPLGILYTSDPLWDGAGCESEGSCCSTAPWFTVDLVNPTTDDIEVRICANHYEYEEDTPVHLLELYVQ